MQLGPRNPKRKPEDEVTMAPAPDLPLDPNLPDVDPSTVRFQVQRPDMTLFVFHVVDTLTKTVREITGDPSDANGIATRLNEGLDYNFGRRWPIAS